MKKLKISETLNIDDVFTETGETTEISPIMQSEIDRIVKEEISKKMAVIADKEYKHYVLELENKIGRKATQVDILLSNKNNIVDKLSHELSPSILGSFNVDDNDSIRRRKAVLDNAKQLLATADMLEKVIVSVEQQAPKEVLEDKERTNELKVLAFEKLKKFKELRDNNAE